MSRSSGFSSSAAVTVIGSSAMPQIGQEPGRSRTISGCMGQVHWVRVAATGISGSSAIPHFGHAPGCDARTSGSMGHTYNVAGEVAAGAVLAGAIVVSCAAAVPFARYFSGSA